MSISWPPEFDADFYLRQNSDLTGLAMEDACAHFQAQGRLEGRIGTPFAARRYFVRLLPSEADTLEIGPWAAPVAKGKNVRYFDVLSAEALRERCPTYGLDPKQVPWKIHYVSSTGDLSIVDRNFDIVFSSHCIEHQPNLVRHLIQVQNILTEGGAYLLCVPDKRYCFDHFKPETTLPDVLDAWTLGRDRHSLRSLCCSACLGTHNDPVRHWQGDHGAPQEEGFLDRIRAAFKRYEEGKNTYQDTHAWFFTPDSFRECLLALHALGLTTLYPTRIYDTIRGSNEFCAVLVKGASNGANT